METTICGLGFREYELNCGESNGQQNLENEIERGIICGLWVLFRAGKNALNSKLCYSLYFPIAPMIDDAIMLVLLMHLH